MCYVPIRYYKPVSRINVSNVNVSFYIVTMLLLVWQGLGIENNWLGFGLGKDHVWS